MEGISTPGSVILTSNKYFSDWGELLSDAVLATALLDRLLHHAHVLNIRGENYRLEARLKSGVTTIPPAQIPALTHSLTVVRKTDATGLPPWRFLYV